MKPGARAQAAIDILDDIQKRHRPANQALADWGRAHRFAGSGDRAAIGNIVFDALRKRATIGHVMGEEAPRALALGALAHIWGETPDAIEAMCEDSQYGPAPVTDEEKARFDSSLPEDAPSWVKGDYPEWLDGSFARAFAKARIEQGAAMAQRAPVDLRVNTLKADREKVLKSLHKFKPEPTRFSPVGLRIAPPQGPGRNPHLEADAGHGKGWFEIQDEGSQIAALLAGAVSGMQVADLCAGSGGKTLALAAAMANKGQLYAWDADAIRLRPIFERLKRAGIRNIQVLKGGDSEALAGLAGKMDVVVIDAPCSGSGVWRRRPDAKWRLRPAALERRKQEQVQVLEQGECLVKPGGRL
ncbi:MAG: RsmB/NOP family class I SAM-dependent RNA methyltransferase, partial [Hyphomicrobiales bacterium]|nr:RsmB/NOP family class I SAM-dependent RNA methyltransferase [Hyphomicrobiales bacterium]